MSSTLSLASVRQVFLLLFVCLLLFVYICIVYMLIGAMFARIDCPECAASFLRIVIVWNRKKASDTLIILTPIFSICIMLRLSPYA